MKVDQIRSKFIDFFQKNNHKLVRASPLVPQNDPSLMFVNSGMVQFKGLFTGLEKRDYTKAVSSQKCVRAGGKHNDLDNVGYTARHHTFFEMLGNFSFGDYFKEDAIHYAWTLLTKEFGINPSKLYATVYHTDDEAYNIWKKVSGFSDDKIIRIKTDDNFWSMGDTGPCGPCSEIFYDHGESIPGGLPGTPNEDGDRYIEIWNMVFMQYEQVDKDKRINLPKPSIDTGMGLERISAVLQGVHDNYDIDLFKTIINESKSLSKNIVPESSHRVIADHLRSAVFLIADGVMPSNEGRGYVLRRIMRRSMRHAHMLNPNEPLVYKLVPVLTGLMGTAFPEITRAEAAAVQILKDEEIRFRKTLDKGLKILEEYSTDSASIFPGEVAFKLYDTFGFPLDLTEDILRGKHIKVDREAYKTEMDKQKERARSNWSGSGEKNVLDVWFKIKEKVGATEFVGYNFTSSQGIILAMLKMKDKAFEEVEVAKEKGKYIIVTNQTPFYGESGGQLGDRGIILAGENVFKVLDTKKYLGSIYAHIGELDTGELKLNDAVELKIDEEYRNDIRIHHSGTHILHSVLKSVLGQHITQKGSLVAHDRLRFDISHPQALTSKEIELIEERVNRIILKNHEVETRLMPLEEAINSGATALFGEKYADEVRVVSMGEDLAPEYSVELCGGTHVSRTGDIGSFKIISESAVAAGIRRIEAVCGMYAVKFSEENFTLLNKVSSILKTSSKEVLEKVENLVNSKRELEATIENLKLNIIKTPKDSINLYLTKRDKGPHLFYREFSNADPKLLRIAAQEIATYDDIVVCLIDSTQGKVSIVVAISDKALSNLEHDALMICKYIASILGSSSGGGSKNIAQAGATCDKLPEIKECLLKFLA